MFDLEKIVRPNILKLKPYSSARDEFNSGARVFLDANENPYGSLNRYPDPYQRELKTSISNFKESKIEQIFVSNGSDETIDLLFRIFCEPGKDKVLSVAPTYGMYKVSAEINNIQYDDIPLGENFELDLKQLDRKIVMNNYKLFFLCNPNNPTGNSYSIKTVASIAEKFKGILVVDEAYMDFSPEESSIALLNKYENVVVLQTMSKAYGLAAARIGMAFANENIISLLNKVKPPYNVSTLNQNAAIKAFENIRVFKKNLMNILEEKKRVRHFLKSLDFVEKVYRSDGNFILFTVDDADYRYNQLKDFSIVIRNRSSQIPNALRITIGSPDENEKVISTLKSFQDEKSAIYR